jgi:hypothetical protein
MNKGLKLIFPAALALVGLAACGSSEAPATVTLKAAHGYYASYAVKAASSRAPQLVQTDITYVGVLLEDDGTILDLKVDVMQTKATGVDATNTELLAASLFTDTEDTKTKWDLLGAYGMKTASPISKEWYEQAYALEQYATGKDVTTLIADLQGVGEEEVFQADITMHVDAFGNALEVALLENNFREFDVLESEVADLKLGIGMSSSQDAKRTNINIGTAVFNDATVVAAEIDVIQVPYTIAAVGDPVVYEVGIDATRAQVDTTNGIIKSKVTLEDAYGMAGASPIGVEYYVQAQSLETYLIGKTFAVAFAESALEDDPSHGSVLADGATIGVTVGIGDYIAIWEEAATISEGRVLPTV